MYSYVPPDKAAHADDVGGGKIWTVEDDKEDDDITGNIYILVDRKHAYTYTYII